MTPTKKLYSLTEDRKNLNLNLNKNNDKSDLLNEAERWKLERCTKLVIPTWLFIIIDVVTTTAAAWTSDPSDERILQQVVEGNAL